MRIYPKTLCCIQPLWYTAKLDQFYAIYLVIPKGMTQKWHLWQELLKSISKIWKFNYDLMTWCRQQILEPLTNSGRSLTWAYKLKVSKSYSQISATSWLKVDLIKPFEYMWWHSHMHGSDVTNTAMFYH